MQRARVDYADISEEDRANILRNTAAGLLGLEPAAVPCDGASTCMWRRIHLGAVSALAGNGPVFCLLRGLAWRSHSLGAAAGPSSS